MVKVVVSSCTNHPVEAERRASSSRTRNAFCCSSCSGSGVVSCVRFPSFLVLYRTKQALSRFADVGLCNAWKDAAEAFFSHGQMDILSFSVRAENVPSRVGG